MMEGIRVTEIHRIKFEGLGGELKKEGCDRNGELYMCRCFFEVWDMERVDFQRGRTTELTMPPAKPDPSMLPLAPP